MYNYKAIYTAAAIFLTAILAAAFALAEHNKTEDKARAILRADNENDSITFVQLHANASERTIRRYEELKHERMTVVQEHEEALQFAAEAYSHRND